jgi:hypothetical protein
MCLLYAHVRSAAIKVRVIEFLQGSYEWVVAAEEREQASKQAGRQTSSKLEEYRRAQEFSLLTLHIWFEDFMCAVVQWYWECVI